MMERLSFSREEKVRLSEKYNLPDECVDCLYARWDTMSCAQSPRDKLLKCPVLKKWKKKGVVVYDA